MSLRPPVDVPDLADLGPVHFIAIGGSGMNGIASAMLQAGLQVSGSDRNDSDYLQALGSMGARVHIGHAADQLGDARTVVASSAIREDNPELVEARRRGLPVLHRSVALAALMQGHRGVAVAGTHGKTTTTAMISDVLRRCGLDPSSVIGGALLDPAKRLPKTGGRLGSGEFFVVEADESDGSFLQYAPEVAVVTNVDADHLSNWGTAENYADGFLRFATGPSVRLLVVSADDAGAVRLTERVRSQVAAEGRDLRIVTFGESPEADVVISDLEPVGTGSTFTLTDSLSRALRDASTLASSGAGSSGHGDPEPVSPRPEPVSPRPEPVSPRPEPVSPRPEPVSPRPEPVEGPVQLVVPGRYNAWNAAAAYAVATHVQQVQTGRVDPDRVRAAFAEFPGTYRRFQLVGTADGVRVFDDYAHHPTEVANTVRAARIGLGGERPTGRLVVCFQPHLYTRTRDFWAEFGVALEPADEAFVMDVCGDREDPIPGVTGAMVADAVPSVRAHVTYEPDWDAAAAEVAALARPGDLVVTVGCGDVTKVAPLILAELAGREATGAHDRRDLETTQR